MCFLITPLNTDLTTKASKSWTQIGYATQGSTITIPSTGYSEIMMILNSPEGSSYTFIYPFVMLNNGDIYPTSGGYASGATYLVNLKWLYQTRVMSIDRVVINDSSDTTLTSSLYVFGR